MARNTEGFGAIERYIGSMGYNGAAVGRGGCCRRRTACVCNGCTGWRTSSCGSRGASRRGMAAKQGDGGDSGRGYSAASDDEEEDAAARELLGAFCRGSIYQVQGTGQWGNAGERDGLHAGGWSSHGKGWARAIIGSGDLVVDIGKLQRPVKTLRRLLRHGTRNNAIQARRYVFAPFTNRRDRGIEVLLDNLVLGVSCKHSLARQ